MPFVESEERLSHPRAIVVNPFAVSVVGDACGPYGHDINFREICAAWRRPPVAGMTRAQYEEWIEYVFTIRAQIIRYRSL